MNKKDLKKVILAQLANTLRGEVIIDGIHGDDLDRADEVQHEIADEFDRRSKGATYDVDWTVE
jgi:hypothetical protein